MFFKYFNLTLEIIKIKVKEEKVLQKNLVKILSAKILTCVKKDSTVKI